MSEIVAPSPTASADAAFAASVERALVIAVHFPEGRYHGKPDWPPAPFRLFSALVAGAYGGRWVAEARAAKDAAFRWLEALPAPIVAVPRSHQLAGYTTYVPNNDIDAVDGDPARVSEIRGSTKGFSARTFPADAPILYVWPLAGRDAPADLVTALADRLHTLGRGIDMAFARAEIVPRAEAEARLAAHDGPVWRPTGGLRPGGDAGRDKPLAVPARGSFDSLVARHGAMLGRFAYRKEGRTRRTLFRQAPVARALLAGYSTAPTLLTYALRLPNDEFFVASAKNTVAIARGVRDRLIERLLDIDPDRRAEILRVIRGDGAREEDKARRIQFLPLPTIGHTHADFGLRRIVLVVPSECPFALGDIRWALRGADLSPADDETGEITGDGPILVETDDDTLFARHYHGEGERRWQSVTPVALPLGPRARKRRSGADKAAEDAAAVAALRQALRHAGFDADGISIRLSHAPNHRHGLGAAAFADERFGAERLVHAAIEFPRPVHGPLALGDGRFLGLGLFAPAGADAAPAALAVRQGGPSTDPDAAKAARAAAREKWAPSIQAFAVASGDALTAETAPAVVAAFRRAVMAQVGRHFDPRARLSTFFSGHEPDGKPSQADPHDHLYFALDLVGPPRLLAIAPHRVDRRQTDRRDADRALLDHALAGFTRLHAGRAGAFDLVSLPEPAEGDPLVGPAITWISATPYHPTRHPKRGVEPAAAIAADAAAQCAKRGLPTAQVEVVALERSRKDGLAARLKLTFQVAVEGPILLGRDAHMGGGLFRREG